MPTGTAQSLTDCGPDRREQGRRRLGRRDGRREGPGRTRGSSVVLEQGQQVVAAVAGEVGGAQVGQQLVRVGQLGKELGNSREGRRGGAFIVKFFVFLFSFLCYD